MQLVGLRVPQVEGIIEGDVEDLGGEGRILL